MQKFLIFDKRDGTYFLSTKNGKYARVKHIQLAEQFNRKTAENIIKNNVGAKDYDFISIIPATFAETEAEANSSLLKKTVGYKQAKSHKTSDELDQLKSIDDTLEKIMGELSEAQQKIDLELSDIYHFIMIHKKLPAHKGYIVYSILRDTLIKRSDIKERIRKLQIVKGKQCARYTPRTDKYEELSEILGG